MSDDNYPDENLFLQGQPQIDPILMPPPAPEPEDDK
jgi:hypothetical protein